MGLGVCAQLESEYESGQGWHRKVTGGPLLVPGRDPLRLLEAGDQALYLIPSSVDVPIAVEVPVLVGSARHSRSRIHRVGEQVG